MKRLWLPLILLLSLLAGLFLPAGPAPRALAAGPPWYVRGDFNGWGTDLMYDDGTHGDDVAGDGIYTVVITITTGGRYEFKVDDGNWTDPHPPSNAWFLTADANQPVKFTFDTNTYNDGWFPSTLIVNAQDGVTTWTAVGDWQSWNPSDPSTVMSPLGGGLYGYVATIPTAGTHYYKAVRSGTWDAIGPQGGEGGRSVNTDNLAFETPVENQRVLFLADVGRARIQVRLLYTNVPVVINEFVAKGTEWIELYNPTTLDADISGWALTSDYGLLNYTFPTGTVILAGGYLVYATGGGFLHNDGDVIHLIGPFGEVDSVGYGIRGAAPIPPQYWGTARVPNGQDTDGDARDWNLDETETPGAANDAPPVALGTSLILNEFDNYPPAGNDKVEIYNPTDAAIDLNGWYLSDGDAVAPIVTHPTVPPGGWVVLEETVDWTVSMDFASADVGYLFLPDRTRVDQIGWYNEYEDYTFQRICDGEGPNDGYDWATSGGGTTWMDLPETLGRPNCAVDIAVEKFGPAFVAPNSLITYTLSYGMQAMGSGHNIVITDTLPDGVSFVTFTSYLAVTLTQVTPTIVFDGGSLPGLMSNTIWLQAQVGDLPFGTVLTNTVEVTCTGDTNPGNNLDTLVSRVVGSEIGIAKTGTTFTLPGYPISYTLTYEVVGEPAQNVVLTDTLPAAVLYISDTAPVTPTMISNTLVWELGTVSATASFVVYGQVSTDPMTWTLRNQAWVASTNDTDPDNNYASWDTDLPMPIAEVQAPSVMTGTWPSRHVGEHVYVMGIVVADSQAYPSAQGNPVRYVLGSLGEYGPWQGLLVYDPGRVVTESQVLVLGGMVSEYYGMTELDNIDYFQVLSDWWPPFPVLTTTAAITTSNPEQAEPLESVLVEVRCAEVTRLPNPYGEWLITDESGVAAQVDDLGDYAYVPQLGDVLYAVRGVLFYAYNNFKLEPRYDADIVLAPTVRSVGPADGATNVPVSTIVTATFNIALNPSTVSTSTFFLEGPFGPVAGTVGYDPATYTAVFTPSAALAYGTAYTAHLTTGIQSGEGAPMCAEYTWSFTTAQAPEPDLTPSVKEADRLYVYPGEVLTFTIRLINVGEIEALATITDVLPAEVVVLTETLPPGMVYSDGLLLWSGTVLPLLQTPLPFRARVLGNVPPGTVFTNLVWIYDGVHDPFTRAASVEVLAGPDIEVSPLELSATLSPGGTATGTLTLRNTGGANLDWGLTEVPPVDWLAETPPGG
ncbi:MAG: lamin tail domain-containing protein, partial [Chloroflexia bacterium]